MPVIGRIKAGNTTQWNHAAAETCTIPLLPGTIQAGDRPLLTAVGAFQGVDQRLQWYEDGPRYTDGSLMRIRCDVPIEVAAGTPNRGRSRLTERIIDVRDDLSPTVTPHQTDGGLLIALAGLTVTIFIEGAANTFTLLNDVREVEPDPDATTSLDPANVKRYLIVGQYRPTDGSPWWHWDFWYEIPRGLQFARWGLHLVDGVLAPDGQRHRDSNSFRLTQPIQVEFNTPFVHCYSDRAWNARPPVTAGLTKRYTLYDHTAGTGNPAAQERRRIIGYGGGFRAFGSISLDPDQSVPGILQDSNRAEQSYEAAGGRDYAISPDHRDRAYGPFQACPTRPPNSSLPDDDTAETQAYAQALRYFNHYDDKRDQFVYPAQGTRPSNQTGSSGGTPDFASLKYWWAAWAGCTDLRSLHLDAWMEGARAQNYREQDGSWMDIEAHTPNRQGDDFYSNIFFWDGGVQWTSQGPNPPFAYSLGKVGTRPPWETHVSLGYLYGSPWNGHGSPWFTNNCLIAFALLTGDYWARRMCVYMSDIVRVLRWIPWPDLINQGYRLFGHIQSPRAEGRTALAAAGFFAVTGETTMRDHFAERWFKAYREYIIGRTIRSTHPNAEAYWTKDDGPGFGKEDVRAPTINPWQEALAVTGFTALTLMMGNSLPRLGSQRKGLLIGTNTDGGTATRRQTDDLSETPYVPPMEYLARQIPNNPLQPVSPPAAVTEQQVQEAAREYVGVIYSLCETLVWCFRNNADTGGNWELAEYITHAYPDANDRGAIVPESAKTNAGNVIPTNPPGRYAHYGNSNSANMIGALMIAWELFNTSGDTVRRDRARDIIENLYSAEGIRGPHGFGGDNNSPYDFAAVMQNPFKDRSGSTPPMSIGDTMTLGSSVELNRVAALMSVGDTMALNSSIALTTVGDSDLEIQDSILFGHNIGLTTGGPVDIDVQDTMTVQSSLGLDIARRGGNCQPLKPIPGFLLLGGGLMAGEGTTFRWANLDLDPRFCVDNPQRGILIRNHTTHATEEYAVTLSSGSAKGNSSTHPRWNAGGRGDLVGLDIEAAFELRDYMAQPIAIFKLAFTGASFGVRKTTFQVLSAIPKPGDDTILLVGLNGVHAHPDNSGSEFSVDLSGLTGLTPDVNGARRGRASISPSIIEVDIGEPISGVSTTGTAAVAAPTFDADESNAWQDLRQGLECFRTELAEAGYDLDMRGVLYAGGEAEVVTGITSDTIRDDIADFLTDLRGIATTRATGPRLPVIMSRLIKHDASPLPSGEVDLVRAGQEAAAAADPQLYLVDLDGIDINKGGLYPTGHDLIEAAERMIAVTKAAVGNDNSATSDSATVPDALGSSVSELPAPSPGVTL